MEIDESNRLEMGKTVLGVMTKYEDIYSSNNPVKLSVNTIQSVIERIYMQDRILLISSKPKTSVKEVTRKDLLVYTEYVYGQVFAYAVRTSDVELKLYAVNGAHLLKHINQGQIATVINDLLSKTSTLVKTPPDPILAEYDLGDDARTKLQEMLASYQSKWQGVGNVRTDKTSARAVMTNFFDIYDEQLEVLDRLMLKYAGNIEFFEAYTAARVIIDRGGGHSGGSATPPPPPPAQ